MSAPKHSGVVRILDDLLKKVLLHKVRNNKALKTKD
jgi:hypothetical protein